MKHKCWMCGKKTDDEYYISLAHHNINIRTSSICEECFDKTMGQLASFDKYKPGDKIVLRKYIPGVRQDFLDSVADKIFTVTRSYNDHIDVAEEPVKGFCLWDNWVNLYKGEQP